MRDVACYSQGQGSIQIFKYVVQTSNHRLIAVVNVAEQPAWLKRLGLRFAVLFSGTMDATGRSGSM